MTTTSLSLERAKACGLWVSRIGSSENSDQQCYGEMLWGDEHDQADADHRDDQDHCDKDGTSNCSLASASSDIDCRIEQAMDLVKSHVLSAVRSEVEELETHIARLESTLVRVRTENAFLRAHVSADVIDKLDAFMDAMDNK